MSRAQSNPRCVLTGIEMTLEVAYVLDLRAAQNRMETVRADLALLERLLGELGGVPVRAVDTGGKDSRQMVFVSGAAANAYEGGVAEGLFIPFRELRKRQDAAALQRVRRHPDWGSVVVGIDDAQLAERLLFGRRVYPRVGFAGGLSRDARNAAGWGSGRAPIRCRLGRGGREAPRRDSESVRDRTRYPRRLGGGASSRFDTDEVTPMAIPLLVVGRGAWPGTILLRHLLREPGACPTVIIDYSGQAGQLVQQGMAEAISKRTLRWIDLGERGRPFQLWRLGGAKTDSLALRYLLGGWVRTMGQRGDSARDWVKSVADIAHEALRASADTGHAEAAGEAVSLGIADLLRLVDRLDATFLHNALSSSVSAAVARALLYPLIYGACAAPTRLDLGGMLGSNGIVWLEIPKTHMELAEWELLCRLVGTAVISWAGSGVLPRRPCRVVSLYPSSSLGTHLWKGLFPPEVQLCAAVCPLSVLPQSAGRQVAAGQPEGMVRSRCRADRDRVAKSTPSSNPRTCAATIRRGDAGSSTGRRSMGMRSSSEQGWFATPKQPAVAVRKAAIVHAHPSLMTHLGAAAWNAIRLAKPVKTPLFERMSRPESLLRGWQRVRRSGKDSAGADEVSVRQFGLHLDEEIARLAEDLATGQYRPCPLRRVRIAKPDGGVRTIALLAVRDRVAQAACLESLDPVLDAVFSDRSFAYRSGRGAPAAMLAVRAALRTGRQSWAGKCDIKRCFDSLDHDILFRALHRCAPDPDMLRVVLLWARAEVLVGGDLMHNEIGVPQGTSLSPLLANLYLTPLDHFVAEMDVAYFRYADDLLLCGTSQEAINAAIARIDDYLQTHLRLELNPAKTSVKLLEEGIPFLGYRVSDQGIEVDGPKLDRLLERVRTSIASIQSAFEKGERASWESMLRSLVSLMRGFQAYYRSVGDERAVMGQLDSAYRAIDYLATSLFPQEVLGHPVWTLRPQVHIEDAFRDLDASSAATVVEAAGYPERRAGDFTGIPDGEGANGPEMEEAGSSQPALDIVAPRGAGRGVGWCATHHGTVDPSVHEKWRSGHSSRTTTSTVVSGGFAASVVRDQFTHFGLDRRCRPPCPPRRTHRGRYHPESRLQRSWPAQSWSVQSEGRASSERIGACG